jgi:hypothetical protein
MPGVGPEWEIYPPGANCLCYPSGMSQAAVLMRRRQRTAMGGTFLVAVALAVQLGQQADVAATNLFLTIPVVALGAILCGWVLRPSAAFAMGAAAAAGIATLGVAQSGSFYTDELLLFAIPFSAAAAIVVGHCRDWKGKTAIIMALVTAVLAIGIGMTDQSVPFAVAHMAVLIALPTVPLR